MLDHDYTDAASAPAPANDTDPKPITRRVRARTIAMHELDHIGDLENKLIKK